MRKSPTIPRGSDPLWVCGPDILRGLAPLLAPPRYRVFFAIARACSRAALSIADAIFAASFSMHTSQCPTPNSHSASDSRCPQPRQWVRDGW